MAQADRRQTAKAAGRTDVQRAADHAAIDGLTNELLPALVEKLAATGLGELEVREGAWRVRLRRPVPPTPGASHQNLGRRATDRGSRPGSSHVAAGHTGSAATGAEPTMARAHPSTNGSQPSLLPVGPGRGADAGPGHPASHGGGSHRIVATSPAVGVYQPVRDLRRGTRVRAGDRLGTVDMLGVLQEVVAPADGIVGPSLADAGQAVEYGQELVELERVGASVSSSASGATGPIDGGTAAPDANLTEGTGGADAGPPAAGAA